MTFWPSTGVALQAGGIIWGVGELEADVLDTADLC